MSQRRGVQCASQLLRQNARRPFTIQTHRINIIQRSSAPCRISRTFHTSPSVFAAPTTADSLMENLTDLYSTAKDEFEIAAEETEKKTVYAADDREAAKEAFGVLKDAYEKAIRESSSDVAKEIQARTGTKIKELGNALEAVEQMAMED